MYGQCGVQGQKQSNTGNVSDVYAKNGTWRWMGGLYRYPYASPPADKEIQFGQSKVSVYLNAFCTYKEEHFYQEYSDLLLRKTP